MAGREETINEDMMATDSKNDANENIIDQGCGNIELTAGHFQYSCPVPHILSIQLSLNLPDIH